MGWIEGTVVARRDWAPGLFTLRIDAAIEPFVPGQWVNLSLTLDGERVKRAYSLASAPGRPLEIYVMLVKEGALTPHLAELSTGDTVDVQSPAHGFFTLDHVPEARDLWLWATGTGLGPYIAMLRSGLLWDRFERVVVVHGARYVAHLGYREELEAMAEARPGLSYVPMVTREEDELVLAGRIPANLTNGHLEAAAGLKLDPERAHILLCGNPGMIDDAVAALAERGLRKHRRRSPGHITVEKYW